MAEGSDLLDDVFNTEVDEKVVSDLVGSLESELTGAGKTGAAARRSPSTENHLAAGSNVQSGDTSLEELDKTGLPGGVLNGGAPMAGAAGTTSAAGTSGTTAERTGAVGDLSTTGTPAAVAPTTVHSLNGSFVTAPVAPVPKGTPPLPLLSATHTNTVTPTRCLPNNNNVVTSTVVAPRPSPSPSPSCVPTVTLVRPPMRTLPSAALQSSVVSTSSRLAIGTVTGTAAVNTLESPKTTVQTTVSPMSTVSGVTVVKSPTTVVVRTSAPSSTTVVVPPGPPAVRTIAAAQVLAPRMAPPPQPQQTTPNFQNIQLPPGMVLITSLQAPGGSLLARQVTPTTLIKQGSSVQTSVQQATTTLQRPPVLQNTIMLGGSATTPGHPLGTATTAQPGSAAPAAPAAPQRIGPTPISAETLENVKKCRNFLSTLIKLASNRKQSPETTANVKELVKNLLEGKTEAEEFTSRLYKELNSSPQPYLVPFLKRSLPALRQMTSDSTAFIHQSASLQVVPQQHGATVRPQVALAQPSMVRGQVHPRVIMSQPQGVKQLQTGSVKQTLASGARGSLMAQSALTVAQRNKLKEAGAGAFRDEDDDINDVASMGGVDLSEESARILATNSELVGAVTRSCKDRPFLPTALLARRALEIGKTFGICDLGQEVVNYISHATRQRLQNLLEKVSEAAQQRNVTFKEDERFEQVSDVRTQLKFFEQLDQMEKQRKEGQEREILMKAAKSRSRQEDPEQLRLKQKAKEMQQLELAQIRQREANLTALAAIGPRKKRKMGSPASGALAEGSGSGAAQPGGSNGGGGGSRQFTRQRITRVNLRDLLFCLENEKETGHSHLLYKGLLK
ncbi:hypothetical protein NHX12_012236 [Muraenolepis orangiensis]|uniref:TAFH domain-containing protein n=1 Tax=Muraenolepis orangiensis TaxID=630683 RepID=A0A9Q0DDY9_9TELE|nr:hypothetical protein NHX12_012236 [Muraenolepis orangiensis]